MNSNTQPASTERTIQVVANRRRRRVLRHLIESADSAVTVDELARDIADGAAADHRSTVEQIAMRLYHVHLPKLAESGLVDYEPHSKTVRYRSHDTVEELLRLISEAGE